MILQDVQESRRNRSGLENSARPALGNAAALRRA
jgi:hypothetical protein